MAEQAATRDWRVVVENPDRAAALAQTAALEGAGLSVVPCAGPGTLPGGVCPLVEAGYCPWIDAADVILHDLDLDDPAQRAVLRTLRRDYPDVPVVLELPEDSIREHADLLEGCHVVTPYDMERLVGAVVDAAAGRKAAKPLPA